MSRNYQNIPPEIAAKLDQSVRRVRRILCLRGVCATLAVFVASVLAIMAVDAMVTIYSSWVRWLLWGAGALCTVAVGWFALAKPLRRKFTAAQVAALIERNHPELEERLSTVVELAQAGDIGSSSRLMEEITKDAVRDAGKVSPRKEFTGRTVKPRLVAAAIALGILGALFAAFPQATLRLATRALNPSAEVDNIYASSLKVSPGDQVVLAGTPLTVNLAVEGGFPSRAFVRTRADGKGESVERMVRVTEEGAEGPVFYSFNYPQVDRSFTYRMSCGSALTRGYRVEVVPEPTYSGRVVEIVHPAYTGRDPERYTNTAAVVGLAGSRVRVSVLPGREGIEGEARLPGDVNVPAVAAADGRLEFGFELSKELQGGWSTVVWDANGFTNQVDTATIAVVKDTPPEIKLVSPEQLDLKLPRNGSLPLEYAIKDDFGLSRTTVEMCLGAGAWEPAETITPDKTGSVTWSGAHVVQFLSKEFGGAGVVRFRIKVEDNLPAELGGPGVAYTPEVMVSVVAKGGSSFGEQSLRSQIESSKKEIEDIAAHLRKAKRGFDGAAGSYGQAEKNDWHRNEATKNSNAARAESQNAEGLLSEFIDGLLDSRLETGAEMFRPVLKDHVTPIRQGAEDVFLMSRWDEKKKSSQNLSKDVDEALRALAEAQRKFDILTKAAEDLQRLEDLAEREKALAEMAEEGQIDAKDLAEEEQKLADELKEEIKDDLEKNLEKQMEKAKELQEKGKELEKRQEEIEKKAEEAARNGDAEAQKQAAHEEKELAKDLESLAKQADALAKEIEKEAGTAEMDDNKTAEPVNNASDLAEKAAQDARAAANEMQEGNMDGAKEDTQGVKDALEQIQQQLGEAQDKMGGKNEEFNENAQQLNDMLNAIEEAVEAAKAAAEAQAAAEANGDQQQGDQQQGDQQQGDQQQGDQQQGDQQQGQQQQGQQQGQQQQGQQQQGQQQQGQQQQGQQQQGQQQQGQQQQGQQQGMQNAAQKAKDAANKMQNQANQQAEQSNLPMDQFQNQQNDSPGGPEGPKKDGAKANPNAKPSGKDDKSPHERRKNAKRGEFEDGDEDDDWFKMKSETGTGAEIDSLDDVPSEYRGLVREYFNSLNKGGKRK